MLRPFATAALLLCAVALLTSGFADDGDVAGESLSDQFGASTMSQHLDAYWSEQRTWLEYGFRPHSQTSATQYSPLPSYWSHQNGYSFGSDVNTMNLDNPLDKSRVQLDSQGTWH